jgi:RNA-binding protein Nova
MEGEKRKNDGPLDEDDNHKRQATRSDSHEHNNKESISLKILCPYKVVGLIIGRGGQTVNGIKKSSGAHIKVSHASETFPGTSERIVLVWGSVNAVLSAAHRIVAELSKHPFALCGGNDTDVELQPGESLVTLTVPAHICGLVIGKGGERIKVLREMCLCKIVMQTKGELPEGLQERRITVVGNIPNVQLAVEKIVLLLAENGIVEYENQTTNYGRPAQHPKGMLAMSKDMASGRPPPLHHPSHQRMMFNAPMMMEKLASMLGMPRQPGGADKKGNKPSSAPRPVRLAIPEELVGGVVGKGGITIKELMSMTGAMIKTSQKTDVVPGTTDRIMTITGNKASCSHAEMLILKKVPEAYLL